MFSTSRLALLVCAIASLSWSMAGRVHEQAAQGATPVDTYRVINVYPHDPQAYTQGLIYRDGFLYESTGLRGRSSLRKVRLETGEVLQQRTVDQAHFAEGLADWKNQLVQLT
jgi:glutamine cyclotransferase